MHAFYIVVYRDILSVTVRIWRYFTRLPGWILVSRKDESPAW